MKRYAFLAILLLLFCSFGVGSAFAFSLGGYSGPIKMKFSNWEQLLEPSEIPYYENNGDGIVDNYGIFYITDIRADDGTNTRLWGDGDNGEYLTGVFYDFDQQSVQPDGAGGLNIQGVRGRFDLYLATDTTFDAGLGTGGYYDTDGILYNEYQGITDQGYAAFASMLAVPGVDPLTDGTQDGNIDATTLPATGDAQFYGSIIPGSGFFAEWLDTDGYTRNYTADGSAVPGTDISIADIYGINDFFPNDGSQMPIQGDWILVSEDPIRGNVGIPEPSTMLLLGAGLMGFAGVARRIRRKKA